MPTIPDIHAAWKVIVRSALTVAFVHARSLTTHSITSPGGTWTAPYYPKSWHLHGSTTILYNTALPQRPPTMQPTRRVLLFAFAAICALVFLTTYRSSTPHISTLQPDTPPSAPVPDHPLPQLTKDDLSQAALSGHAIAPKLGNETAKAELGRATWKYLHTVMARFPDKPTPDESAALKSYIYLFQRLYPCGECAAHFGQILAKFPPQVSSRSAAAGWACHVHNEVNKSLGKELFDCSKIGDFYDCGCAEDEVEGVGEARDVAGGSEGGEEAEMSDGEKERITGVDRRDTNFEKMLHADAAG